MGSSRSDPGELADQQKWLKSHKPEELFKDNGDLIDEVKAIVPEEDSKRLGQRKEVYAGYEDINTVDWKALCTEKGGKAS